MQLTIDLDNAIVDQLKKDFKTDNIKDIVYKLVDFYQHKDEYTIAKELNQSLNECKQGNTKPVSELLNAI